MEGVVPRMGGKKKVAPAGIWTLAGEPVYSSALAPAEERVFKETVSHFREVASRMREDSDRFSRAMSAAREGEQAARASVGFFLKHFEGKYQRIDVVKALATASMLPAPSAERFGTSPSFMLGAVLWLLDYVKRQELEEEFYPLLPEEVDEEIDFATPDVDDLNHSRDEILGVMSVFMNRKGNGRKAFRRVWGLVDKETAREIKTAFKDAVLDYLDRFLEVSTRVSPSAANDTGSVPSLLANPAPYGAAFDTSIQHEPEMPGSPAKDRADLWFLMNTAQLIGASSNKIRQTLYYRRSAELMEGFRVRDPYAVCAAFLLLERDGDVLTELNMLTAAVVICAERHLPWGPMRYLLMRSPLKKARRIILSSIRFPQKRTRRKRNCRTRTSKRGIISQKASYSI